MSSAVVDRGAQTEHRTRSRDTHYGNRHRSTERMGDMKRIAIALLAGAVGATALLSGTAAASGPAPPPKDIFEVECEGLGSVIIAAPASEGGHGVAEIVGEKGHGIPVSSSVTVTDVTKGTV